MTPEKAASLVSKLEALADPARGGTASERATAQRKAADLRRRFNLDRPSFSAPRAGPAPRSGPIFTAPRSGPAWEFNVKTGKGSKNVRVDYYRNRANWRIEVEI
jgi:hypothetical protein